MPWAGLWSMIVAFPCHSLGCLLLCGSLSPCGAMGWSVVYDCGISLSFSWLFAVVWEFVSLWCHGLVCGL